MLRIHPSRLHGQDAERISQAHAFVVRSQQLLSVTANYATADNLSAWYSQVWR